MTAKVKTALILTTISAISFAFVLLLMHLQWIPDPGANYAGNRYSSGQAETAAIDLLTCVQADIENAKVGNSKKCEPAVDTVLDVTRSATDETFQYIGRSNFDVFQTETLLILLKRSCTDADIEVPSFGWNAWPADLEELPEDRKQYGNYSGGAYFNKTGIRAKGACIILVKLPTQNAPRFYVGQQRDSGQYLWLVERN